MFLASAEAVRGGIKGDLVSFSGGQSCIAEQRGPNEADRQCSLDGTC